MSTARSRPADLSLPADGGAWLKQSYQDTDQQLHGNNNNNPPGQSEQSDQHNDQQQQTLPSSLQPHQHPIALPSETRDQSFVYYNPNSNSSASDLTSPLTPTFSHHGGSHLRYASSTSSLDLQAATSSTCSDSPVSPAQPPHNASNNNNTSASANKRLLPDVQEEPLERDGDSDGDLDEDRHSAMTMLTDDQMSSLYDCLCDSPCIHQNSDMVHSADWTRPVDNDLGCFEYDMGFLSDGDQDPTLHPTKRNGADSPLAGLTMRLGTRFPTLNRWRSTKRRHRAFTAASEPSLDLPPALSRATSTSRSSSLSAPSRRFNDRSNEPPLPPTPALSFYEFESTESIPIPRVASIDIERASAVRQSIERERALATTPLLPPLMTEVPSIISSQTQSQAPSPLQSPTIAPQLGSELNSPVVYATPPLSTKPSFSSFRPPLLTSLSSPVVATSDVVCTIPHLLEQHDAWSDRLGHANYTILPRPYNPQAADFDTLRTLRADWDLARINYTKHIVRTGEHYGTTSKAYALTEAKWAETEREWKQAHDALLDRVAALNPGFEAQLRWDRLQDDTPTAIPKMLDAEGKFPDLGDEDIVGPMVRDAVMVRDPGSEAENGARKFWKNLAGKVGLRK
ncbi:hypothetical protein N8I77_005243 [Diaporthe amygdali]|uniref:Only prolin and serin are matching in the corresponding protein n=1 Tax=Phomopsis amygdali TaxID=1214568 RepID=A0AAD9SEN7_PHOAM|nr:hypothetical protein N8I77_005243 [Diaporthe amygdali]